MNFVCEPCQAGADLKNPHDEAVVIEAKKFWHKKCLGPTRCVCQHRTDRKNV